jgi:hypothetical protein
VIAPCGVAAREQSARKRSSRRGKNKKRHFARTDPSMNVDES